MNKITIILKKYIKKYIIYPYERFIFLQSNKYRDLKKNNSSKKIILLDTPTHGNLGDQAIVLAIEKFLNSYLQHEIIFEFTHRECVLALDKLRENISDDDIILIPGGGFLGSLWMNEQELFINIVEGFCENRIVIFPHTIYFETSEKGNVQKEIFISKINKCKDISIFAREIETYNLLRSVKTSDGLKIFECPDIVTMLVDINELDNKGLLQERKNVLLCLRQDKEKYVEDNWISRIKDMIKNKEISEISTYWPHEIKPMYRYQEVFYILIEFSRAELVITDRLHAMLFCLITQTPCIAFDNVSKKVSGTYERWLKGFEYIKFINNETEISKICVEELLSSNRRYDSKVFTKYYNKIISAIIG